MMSLYAKFGSGPAFAVPLTCRRLADTRVLVKRLPDRDLLLISFHVQKHRQETGQSTIFLNIDYFEQKKYSSHNPGSEQVKPAYI
jgi:hypothetical protein